MKLTESRLRRIIREELSRLDEEVQESAKPYMDLAREAFHEYERLAAALRDMKSVASRLDYPKFKGEAAEKLGEIRDRWRPGKSGVEKGAFWSFIEDAESKFNPPGSTPVSDAETIEEAVDRFNDIAVPVFKTLVEFYEKMSNVKADNGHDSLAKQSRLRKIMFIPEHAMKAFNKGIGREAPVSYY